MSEVHEAVADGARRRVLYCLRESGGVAGFEELVDRVAARSDRDSRSVRRRLRRSTLPALEELGALAYVPDEGRVVYRGGSYLTEVIEAAMHREGRG